MSLRTTAQLILFLKISNETLFPHNIYLSSREVIHESSKKTDDVVLSVNRDIFFFFF